MKTIFFLVAMVTGFVEVNAQSSATADATINLTIVKTVEISPSPLQSSFDVTFNQPSQFGTQLPMGTPRSWVINATDPGSYQVNFNRGNIPAGVVLRYDLFENLAPVNTQTDISTNVNRSFTAGAGFGIAIKMYANVPWGIASGSYSGSVVITATAP